METPLVLSVALEKAFRRKVGNAVALRAILLSRQRLGKRIHDLQGFYRSDPTGYQSLSLDRAIAKLVYRAVSSIISTCDFRVNFKNLFPAMQQKASGKTLAAGRIR